MKSEFLPKLINNPLGDPGMMVEFLCERRSLQFDLGDLFATSNSDLLKISHVFISHTHIDHFIGFDHLLRIIFGRGKTVYFFGPENFIKPRGLNDFQKIFIEGIGAYSVCALFSTTAFAAEKVPKLVFIFKILRSFPLITQVSIFLTFPILVYLAYLLQFLWWDFLGKCFGFFRRCFFGKL